MSDDMIIMKCMCTDCKYCLINEVIEVCKLDSELFNPNGLTECSFFEGK